MNEHTDIERVLERWFDDGPSRMPDRVAVVVAERIDRQRQRRPWRLPWRLRTMNLPIKIGAAVAAVLILAVAAWNLMPGPSTSVGGPTLSPSPPASAAPSPAASSSPSTAPSASAAFPAWFTPSELPTGAGILPAGTSTTRSYKP